MLIKIESHRNLKVEENVELILGKRCGFNGMVIQNDGVKKAVPTATVRIGDNFHSGKGCLIRTSDHDFSRGYPLVNGHISGYKSADVTIGSHVWFGNDVLVMKGVTIGDGAIIQAKSVIVSDIPALSIAGGHPCRVFAQRDPEEYEFLLSLGLWEISKDEIESRKAHYEEKMNEYSAGSGYSNTEFVNPSAGSISMMEDGGEETNSSLEGALLESRRELKALTRRNEMLENQIELARKKVQKMASKPAGRILYPNSLANLTRVLQSEQDISADRSD